MISILDIGGNYGSLLTAFDKIGVEAVITSVPDWNPQTKGIVIPGVGRADNAMRKIKEMEWGTRLQDASIPVLGICCGFHVMCRHSEEGDVDCLGFLPWEVKKLPKPRFGWENTCCGWQYFCHLYAPLHNGEVVHHTGDDNFTGVQFHPEKSGKAGLEFLKKWVSNG